MKGADIAVAWVDSSGQAHIQVYDKCFAFELKCISVGLILKKSFQDRFAFDKAKPIIDNTTQDWFVLQGQEQDGWTAIQFKRYFDSCDLMDVPIKVNC